MTQLLSIDDDIHAALKLMSAEPREKRGMKAIVQDALNDDKQFVKVLSEARRKLGVHT
jgi:hypothetical protein